MYIFLQQYVSGKTTDMRIKYHASKTMSGRKERVFLINRIITMGRDYFLYM